MLLVIAIGIAGSATAAGNTGAKRANVTARGFNPILITKNTDLRFAAVARPGTAAPTNSSRGVRFNSRASFEDSFIQFIDAYNFIRSIDPIWVPHSLIAPT